MNLQVAAALILGPILGSFASVLYSRGLTGQSIVYPNRSFCFACGKTLTIRENIPLLSFVIQNGKCRNCNAKIDPGVFIVELLTFFLICISSLQQINSSKLSYLLILAIFSPALVLIDIRVKRVPNGISLLLLSVTLIASLLDLVFFSKVLIEFLFKIGTALLVFSFYFLIYLISKGGIGFGDVKLSFILALIAIYFSWQQVITSVILAFFTGALVGIYQLIFLRKGRKHQIPFVPFMIIGTWIALLADLNFSRIILSFWNIN